MIYTLCERIAELRKTFGITQTELAKRLEVTRSAVNAWEMGFATPQLKHIVEMSKIFNTTVDGLLNTSSKVVIDITDLTEKEQEAVFNIVDCLKAKNGTI
ncbi:MAG: helix-turn-helix transcriptional regulator [Oscillospiraceae bacterium]|nr:helix-turn-helix transcriptional regulator [Oscillospiraceae bacterium]